MSDTKYKNFIFDAETSYAQVFESNRDMGNEEYPHDDVGGVYKVDLLVSNKVKDDLVAKGFPIKKGAFDTFKKVDDETWKFRATRNHKSKNNNADGEEIIFGPPTVFDFNAYKLAREADGNKGNPDDYITPWIEADGLIGNGTKVKARITVQDFPRNNGKRGQRIVLEKLGIVELVPYGASGGDYF